MKIRMNRRFVLSSFLAMVGLSVSWPVRAQVSVRQVKSQYIAVLGDPNATSGVGAETWGFWREDPGPIGVWLSFYKILRRAGNIAPSGWRFDIDDWWLDENGLIMKAPEFPMPAGRYYVTNGEENISLLTVEAPDKDGRQSWFLSDGKTIGDVTHGPCRSARYTPQEGPGTCSPQNVGLDHFPLMSDKQPPEVVGCDRQIYAVLIVFAYPADS